jgi:negative regulator of sigma E activity
VVVITLPKQDELERDTLLRIVTMNPLDLYINSYHLDCNQSIESLTYNYTIDFNKEHDKYEVVDVDAKGIINNTNNKIQEMKQPTNNNNNHHQQVTTWPPT